MHAKLGSIAQKRGSNVSIIFGMVARPPTSVPFFSNGDWVAQNREISKTSFAQPFVALVNTKGASCQCAPCRHRRNGGRGYRGFNRYSIRQVDRYPPPACLGFIYAPRSNHPRLNQKQSDACHRRWHGHVISQTPKFRGPVRVGSSFLGETGLPWYGETVRQSRLESHLRRQNHYQVLLRLYGRRGDRDRIHRLDPSI